MILEKTATGLHKEIIDLLPKKRIYKKYLDVGCGFGAFLEKIRKKYVNGYGTDVDIKSIQFKDKSIVYEKADFNKNIPFKSKTFDLITCIEVIEHIENQFFLLRELANRLNKNGLLVITSPNISNMWSRLLFFLTGKFINYSDSDVKEHINPLIENIFEEYLKKINVKILKKAYYKMHIPILNVYLPLKGKLFGNNIIYILTKD